MFYEYAFKETYNLKGKDTILEARRAFVDKWPQELKKKVYMDAVNAMKASVYSVGAFIDLDHN